MEGDTDSDLARIRRQQIVLSAILQQVTSAGTLLNPAKLDAFMQAFVQNTFTDNVTIDDLVTLAQSFGTLDPSRVTFFTLPTVPSETNPDALDVDESKAPAVFDALLNDQPLPGEPAATSAATAPATPTQPTPGGTVDRHNGRPGHGRPGHRQRQRSERGRHRGDGSAQRRRVRRHRGRSAGAAGAAANAASPSSTTRRNLAAALTVAAAVPGATLVPTEGLGSQVRLLLGESYDGTVHGRELRRRGDRHAVRPDGKFGRGPSPPSATLTSGELASINAGEALCA